MHQNFCLTIFHLIGNTVKACQSLEHHILALELDMEVFMEVLEPFVKVAMPKLDAKHIHRFTIDFSIEKRSKRLLDNEYVVHLHQYYVFLQFFLLYASHSPFSLFVECRFHRGASFHGRMKCSGILPFLFCYHHMLRFKP